MTTSNELHWQSQKVRRKQIGRFMLLALLTLLIVLVALCFWLTQPLLYRSKSQPTVRVDSSRLKAHVAKISGELSPRNESNVENLNRVASFIRAEFEKAGGLISDQPYEVNRKTYMNVVAGFGPDTQELIVVGAHYDAAGPFPGADDNASGVAGLIELARLLRATELPVRVELVAFSLEEPPYFRTSQMGSFYHAASLRNKGAHVRAMICLEMIGYFSDAPGSQSFPVSIFGALYPSQGNFIGVVGRFRDGLLVRRVKQAMSAATPLPVYSINAPAFVPGVDFSDQVNYWRAGYDAVMITDTAFYRNPNYHTAGDTADTLDYQRMGFVVEGVYAAVLDLAHD